MAVGSADVLQGTPVPACERDLAPLLDVLPVRRTVLSDVAAVPGHRPYQDVLARLADEREIRRARFLQAFRQAGRRDVISDDGVHLNSTGYAVWFRAFRPHLDAILEIP